MFWRGVTYAAGMTQKAGWGTTEFLLLSLLVHTGCCFRRVCYFTNWSRDLQQAGARFQLTDIEPFLCTHLLYAFASVTPANSSLAPIVTKLNEGREAELQRYRDFNALKQINHNLKTLLSIGGSIQANEDFVQLVSTAESRQAFATHVVTYLRTWGFDGLDVDWEYPGNPPETKPNFTELLKALRKAFQADASERNLPPLLLSVAAPVSQSQMKAGYDVPQVSSLVDFINLMAYDFHGSWNSITSFNSPLYARTGDPRFSSELSVNGAVVQWLRQGAEAKKLVLGIAGYGQSFALVNESQHDVGAPTNGSGIRGRWRRMEGQLSYYEVCEYIAAGGTEEWDDLQRVPYVYLGNQWVGFDNPLSIREKVSYALEHSLGGIMLWSLDMDDFRGAYCGNGRYPLLTAMVDALANKLPDVTVRLTDTVTWPHPDDVSYPMPPGTRLLPSTTSALTSTPSRPATTTTRTMRTTTGAMTMTSYSTRTAAVAPVSSTTTATASVPTASPSAAALTTTTEKIRVLTKANGSSATSAPVSCTFTLVVLLFCLNSLLNL